MMLDLKYFKNIGYLKGIVSFLQVVVNKKVSKITKKHLWGVERISFENKFPRLLLDENLENSCDSCGKCVEVCPTNCLSVLGKEGKTPSKFELEIQNCISCSLCEEVCPPEAIAMSESTDQFNFTEKQVLTIKELYLSEEKSR
jgi:formate hydrogenlyase subunit 6/NADH:ubiquinone oxidoreductase subunit I